MPQAGPGPQEAPEPPRAGPRPQQGDGEDGNGTGEILTVTDYVAQSVNGQIDPAEYTEL
jgi:hypothetical protein